MWSDLLTKGLDWLFSRKPTIAEPDLLTKSYGILIAELHGDLADTRKHVDSLETKINEILKDLHIEREKNLLNARVINEQKIYIQTLESKISAIRIVQIVEDDPTAAEYMMGILGGLATTYELTLVPVRSLKAASRRLEHTRFFILDVGLPDSNPEKCRSFIGYCHPTPVIVISATKYTKADFPGCREVIQKGCPPSEIIALIEAVIRETKSDL